MGWFLILLLAALGVLAYMLGSDGTLLGLDMPDIAALTLLTTLLIVFALSLLGSYRGRLGHAARDFLVWAGLAIGLVAGYSYKDDIISLAYRVRGELAPPGSVLSVEPTRTGEQAVRIRRRGDGHFTVNAKVNGASMSMLVDTGASSVVLRQADAARLGVDTSRLRFNVPVQTANGVTYAAHVRLNGISVGPIVVEGVDALVAKPGALRENLLGMTFLSRLRSYEFTGDFLTFRS